MRSEVGNLLVSKAAWIRFSLLLLAALIIGLVFNQINPNGLVF